MRIHDSVQERKLASFDILYLLFRNLLWGGALISYYFQFPFPELARYIIPCFAGYFLISSPVLFLKGIDRKFFFIWIFFGVFLTLNLFVSIAFFHTNDTAWRFYLILLIIPLCFFLYNPFFSLEYKIFKYLSLLKAFFLIGIALYMIYIGDYQPFRLWANTIGGDMYFIYDIFPRIQIYGNALLLFAFLIELARKKSPSFPLIIFFIGVILEGNFSFYLAIVVCLFCYFITYIKRKGVTVKTLFAIVMMIVFSMGFLFYALDQRERKTDGGNAVRALQAEVLMSGNPFVGEGVGARVFDNVRLGRQVDDKYFELQTLYIFFQVGGLGLFLFYWLNVLALRKLQQEDVWFIYLAYLVGSFFNPYCFDVTQMVVVTLCGNYLALVER